MINCGGVWLPDGETHLVDWMLKRNERIDGKLTYQYHKLRAALQYVKKFDHAVDVGAHCGLWSMHLARKFLFLQAYEPVAAHRECFAKNVSVEDGCEVGLYPIAIGEHDGFVKIHTAPTSSGDSWVDGVGDIPMRRLDDLLVDQVIDFLKLDCEGYELFALLGAGELLKRSRPCVIVEQKPGRAQKFGLPERGAVDYLQSLGAKLRLEMSGDFILSWD